MWKIAICDDEEEFCRQTEVLIGQLGEKLGEKFVVEIFRSAEEMLQRMSADTDILLLDIKMGDMSGIDAARVIRRSNEDLCIIFITSMTEYAMEGYEVHAFGFIKKPVSYAPLERNLREAVKRLEFTKNDTVAISDKNGTLTLRSSNIIYIEAFRHDVELVTTQGRISTSKTLSELEEVFTEKGFFRTHKSYLVNLRHIRTIDGSSLSMSDGSTVLLSKHRKKQFMESFIEFSGGLI